MTEDEAIKFLQGRRRFMLTDKKLSNSEVISVIRRGNISLITSGSVLFSSASILLAKHRSGYGLFFGTSEIVLGFVIIGFFVWSQIRLRQACKVLNYPTEGSSGSSGTQ
jgi:hypothetical protein